MAEVPIEEENELTPGYKTPAVKPVNDIVNLDTDDESLQRYKKNLLGASLGGTTGKKEVIVDEMNIAVEGRPDICLDLKDLQKVKNTTVCLKEKSKYRLKLKFAVKGDIVTGFKMFVVIKRIGAVVLKSNYMIGSYGPKDEMQEFIGQEEEAPDGMIGRGKYEVKIKFQDDDQNEYRNVEWHLEIKKHWPEEKEAKK